jgi:arylsulfate sulfotransferase
MLNGRLRCGLSVLIAGCFLASAGCGGGGSGVAMITPSSALISPGQSAQFSEAGHVGDTNLVWLVNGVVGGSASTGTITSAGVYTAPATALSQPVTISIQAPCVPGTVNFFNPNQFAPGSVAATQNPIVAAYSITIPEGSSVRVQFGPDTSYGLSTSGVVAPPDGGSSTVLVAGMRAGTTYHMQAVVELANGLQVLDKDHTFATGIIPADQLPNITAETTGVGTLSPGVELFSLDPAFGNNNALSTVATDPDGNVIWYYNLESGYWPYPIKPLPNGHMMLNASPVAAGASGGAGSEIREIDLAGNIVNSITLDQVNQALAAVAPYKLEAFHHDFALLPNGHIILLGNYPETINNVPGIPPGTVMLGDALVDWTPQGTIAWTWSTFDHLNLTHAPYGFTDWTHSNAIIYSPTDGNLILSMRNQNWIIKINYQDGAGDGSILWTFGDGGDFTLPGQEAPIEWNYGQHYPTITSPNSSGVFNLMFFNNGNSRLMNDQDVVCGSYGVPNCYSSVPMFQVDESTKTASVLWEDNLTSYYSVCCGDAVLLPSGNTEFDVAYDILGPPDVSHIMEVTPSQELVWQMNIAGQLAYRGFRIPSLYPGQSWSAPALSGGNRARHEVSQSTNTGPSARKSLAQLP